ncbi:MAG: putative ABC transporter-binding protein precursor [Chloroflexi bacterium ADurb.Bin325]|nr:MAG: putative ABC transporter-binding protein precursor [Chloroflexi bacterium ADurb.Bin325]
MKRLYLLFLLLLIPVFLLSGCSGGAAPAPAPAEPAAPAAEAPAAEAPAAEAPAAEAPAAEAPAAEAPAAAPASDFLAPGAFVNDPNSGRDFNLADFVAEYGPIAQYSEAPMLAEQVAAGKLPPVEERLPKNPVVSIPLMDIGKYGGDLHWVEYTIDYDHYLRHLNDVHLLELVPEKGLAIYKWMGGKIMPGVFEAWTVSDDATKFTFTLREGLRWSDGEPVTSEDIRYTIEDVLLNTELTPVVPQWLNWGGKPTKFEVLDDRKVALTFGEPYGFFLPQMVGWSWPQMVRPAHYLKQFHTAYTGLEELVPAIEKAGLTSEDWARWYLSIDTSWTNGEYFGRIKEYRDAPVLQPYVWKSEPQQGDLLMERNPYFYKVDPMGNQLPYIDTLSRSLVADLQAENLKIISGETDLQCQFTRLSDYPMFAENADKAGYDLMALPAWQDQMLIFPFNMLPKDENLKKALNDVRFRQALSLAIDREEVKKSIFLDFGTPSAFAPVSGSPWYKDEFRDAYAQFDVDKANALLDEMGLKWDASHEFRMYEDGSRLILPIDYYDVTPPATPGGELVREFWKVIGVDTQVKQVSGQLYWEMQGASDNHGTIWWANGLSPADQVFVGGFLMTSPWWSWQNSDGQTGEEPADPAVLKLFDLYKQIRAATSDEERLRVGNEIFQLHADNVWVIGTVADTPIPFVYDKNLGNVAIAGERGYYSISAMELAEQFYWK